MSRRGWLPLLSSCTDPQKAELTVIVLVSRLIMKVGLRAGPGGVP
jgi:hypothetical protein